MDTDLNAVKVKLEEEKAKLENELSSIGTQNPNNPDDWQAKVDKSEGDNEILEKEADSGDVADNLEEFGSRYSLVNDVLEVRLKAVNDALLAIENGTYGTCNVGGETHQIERERLEANLSATSCVAHMKA